ncbi:MAG: TRAP transporter fused permease subunit [Spirochaetales bacterium]|jgi:TRAP transporter 4TM/12TM fusion protein|nr:TRAP transporter fused permease subunit [Spirochaetales bacterium]
MAEQNIQTWKTIFKVDSLLIFRVIAVIFPILFLSVAYFPVPDHIMIGTFIWLVWILTLAFKPLSTKTKEKTKVPFYDWILIAAATYIFRHYVFGYYEIMMNMGIYTLKDYIIIISAIVISLETARRIFGWVLPLIAVGSIGFLIYAGFMPDQILGRIFLGELGMFGSIADVFARYVLLFMIFGRLMEQAGGTEFLYRLILRLKKVRGGPAKAAVIGSAVLGMIMGSSAGNVAVTGSMTIPMMKRVGYKPQRAGAIEVAASLGGELTPPVMGAAAFLVVANTGVPYREVILLSILPAILYYIPIFLSIHFEAEKYNFVSTEEVDETGPTLMDFSHLFVPPIVLVALIIIGYSPTYGAAAGIIAIIIVSQFRKKSRMSFFKIVQGLMEGALSFLNVGAAAAVLGFIMVGVIMAGVPGQFGNWAIGLTGGSLPLVIFVVFAMGLVLGMGIPIVGSYLILATVAGPALESFGVNILGAHLLIMWFCETAAVTPPVCLATFVACGIAGSKMWPTAKEAMKLVIGMYLIPILFLYTPLVSGTLEQRLMVFAFAATGFVLYSILTVGYFKGPIHIGMLLAGWVVVPMLFFQNIYVNIAGAVLVCLFIVVRYILSRRRPA